MHLTVSGDSVPASKRGTNFLDDCLKDFQCAACVRPCHHANITTSLANCHRYCQAGESACVETCGFLKLAHTTKPGSCHAPEAATGFEAACIQSCTKDGDCGDHLKCCSNGPDCGFTCQKPDKLSQDIPKMPHFVKVTESRKGRAAIVNWHGAKVSNDSLVPPTVIYVLQYRHILSPKPNWGFNTPWLVVTQTTRRNYLVRNIQPGHWYQFRVAAVVANGTNGFTDPTAAFKSSQEIQAPSPPRNLTQAGFTIHDGKIDLNMSWLAPSRTDLPIIKYKLYWSQRLRAITAQMVSLYVHKQNVPANRTWTVIKGLNSDTTYFIQVEAIARQGDYRMKSQRTSELITTYEIPSVEDTEPPTTLDFGTFDELNLITVYNVSTEPPFYENLEIKCLVTWEVEDDKKSDITKYMITWKPVTCGFRGDEKTLADIDPTGATSHTRSFFVYGLQFGCHYVVNIRVVNLHGVPGPVTEGTFFVPQCSDILVKASSRPECPTLAEPLPPLKPRQLQNSIYVAGNNISVVVKWKTPHSDASIDRFRVTWGIIGQRSGVSDRSHSRKKDLSEMDKKTVKTMNLPGDAHRAVLETLAPYSEYAVEVAAVSKAGQGSSARLEFSTPALPTLTTRGYGDRHGKPADQPQESDMHRTVVESHHSDNQALEKSSTATTAAFSSPSSSSSSTSSLFSRHSLTDSINALICVTVALVIAANLH
ncbi:anosmin-1-like [Liolophura sinensis]|uniref:anosmin-1-like n=1 Tax=Liolophura sinensis TaxID=3198878 RepID=UPI003157F3DE